MRRFDENTLDPEVAASLDAIDMTLAGEPVDPTHAELAELALLLAAERPAIPPEVALALDEKLERRLAPAPPKSRRQWLVPAAGGISAAVAATVAVVVFASGTAGPGSSPPIKVTGAVATAPVPERRAPAARGAIGAQSSGSAATESLPAFSRSTASTSAAPSPTTDAHPLALAPAATSGGVLQPAQNGRKIVQSAQLALSTAPSRIDAVAQEAFDVIGRENGIVRRSNVTATGGPDGYAEFQLSVPSSELPATMAALSRLHYARVASRTDTTQDVNDEYQGDVRRLADARALRTSLLQQLANASTQQEIDSLKAQLHDAEASISSDEATLRALNRQIGYSQIMLSINAGVVPVPVASSSGGFTIAKAAHDAGRVLTVAAGVALIGLAALVPAGLVGAFVWWIITAIRRRRREQALDLA